MTRQAILLLALGAMTGRGLAYDTIKGSSCIRSMDGMLESMDDLIEKYPGLIRRERIGASYLATHDGLADGEYDIPEGGHDIYAFVVTADGSNAGKGRMLLTSGVHSREMAPPELLGRFVEKLVYGYDEDADVTWILEHNEVHVVLYVNPDGRFMAERYPELLWRKNLNPNGGCRSDDSYGTDLNRNFDFMWSHAGGSSSDPCDSDYHGSDPESEPESQALADYARRLFPAGQRKSDPEGMRNKPFGEGNTGVYVDVHASGGYVYYPWGHVDSVSPDDEALQALGRKTAYFNDYRLWAGGQKDFLYAASGDISDWMYGAMGAASMGLEIGEEWNPDCDDFESRDVPMNLSALLYAVKISKRPFRDVKGPDVLDLRTSREGGQIKITATASDGEMVNQIRGFPDFVTGGQAIDSVKVYLDVHPDDYKSGDTIWTMKPREFTRRLELEDSSSAQDRAVVCSAHNTKKKCKRRGGDACEWRAGANKRCVLAGEGSETVGVSQAQTFLGVDSCDLFTTKSKCKKFGGEVCFWNRNDKLCSSSDETNAAPNPIDSSFDSGEEDVELSIEASSLEEGRHQLFIQATDSAGYQGPVSSVFVEVSRRRLRGH